MTVSANIAFGLEMRRLPRRACETRVQEVLALVGLEAHAAHFPRQLSGGQQQRVALARALVIQPSLLLLDEPLSNLDAKLREEMRDELRSIQRRTGATTLLVTHDQAEAMALSDRIVVMNRGHVEQIATPQDAYARPATAFVAQFLGRTNLVRGCVYTEGGHSHLRVGGVHWLLPHGAPNGPVMVTVRPERIALTGADGMGLPGQISARVFQGHEWLHRVETSYGTITVVSPNRGLPAPAEGDVVRLHWEAEDISLAPVRMRH
jgi:putative spermidine/putrescine transport system ATP-binding protein